jgi:DNA-binding NarL/FixJ family response regulator
VTAWPSRHPFRPSRSDHRRPQAVRDPGAHGAGPARPQVLTLVGLGLSNTEIPSRLHISLSTAKTHVGRLLVKFGARDRAQHIIAA